MSLAHCATSAATIARCNPCRLSKATSPRWLGRWREGMGSLDVAEMAASIMQPSNGTLKLLMSWSSSKLLTRVDATTCATFLRNIRRTRWIKWRGIDLQLSSVSTHCLLSRPPMRSRCLPCATLAVEELHYQRPLRPGLQPQGWLSATRECHPGRTRTRL